MPTRQRPVDRGSELARVLYELAREFRAARRDRGLSLRAVGAAASWSAATVWRFQRGLSPNVSLIQAAQLLAVVGLDLSARAFAGPAVARDAAQIEVAGLFRAELYPSLRWGSEVPFPTPGDQRRWDGLVNGAGWRFGVECETGPQDAQALAGRLQLRVRDGAVDGVILVLPATRRVRAFLAAAAPALAPVFTVAGSVARSRLRLGQHPGGNAIVLVQRRRAGVSSDEPTRP